MNIQEERLITMLQQMPLDSSSNDLHREQLKRQSLDAYYRREKSTASLANETPRGTFRPVFGTLVTRLAASITLLITVGS